ncbi:hypothetical protein QFC24_000170 [Naganishia onofrii]|uniref:Uncharacterized protein n=1 Tax=Naganishia onofrii TaxID=1851511 RepID=A0ACC2XV26_9TREE|nr:hypothetical protein QFC24_000170 [Naganishia onofrii]
MIQLENHNVIIQNVLTERFVKPGRVDINFVDYDNVRFHLSTPTSKTQLVLSMGIQCWRDLAKYGVNDMLESEYGDWLIRDGPEKEQEYDVSLMIDLEKIPEDEESRTSLIYHLSMLKPMILSAPFRRAYETHKQLAAAHSPDTASSEEQQGDMMIINYREEEAFVIQSSWDRITVYISTAFKEETDRVFGRVFLQEFVDARRLSNLQSAPQVLYTTREPPLELRNVPGLKKSDDMGYVTFVLFPRHFANEDTAKASILQILTFRNYLHYHLKASKSYMHSRMRIRVHTFGQILNRAKPEVQAVERRTATGRTFRSR